MNISFIKETGFILAPYHRILSIIEGESLSVNFPSELILQLHKMSPGIVYELAHTHPDGMSALSARDEQTLKTLTHTLYPFSIRMSTITKIKHNDFIKTTYLAYLEPKEFWLPEKQIRSRKFSIIVEHVYEFTYSEYLHFQSPSIALLIDKSYE